MRDDRHAPRSEFVEQLAAEISREIRRRNRAALEPPQWIPRSRAMAIAAVIVLVVVSMGAGGAVVAAAYLTHSSQQREQLVSTYQRRVDLARQKLEIATQQYDAAERQVSLGLVNPDTAAEARFAVREAQAQLRSMQLQLEEVRSTGVDARSEATAPIVSGRDFVLERWQIELDIPRAALELEQSRLAAADRRAAIGVAPTQERDAIKTRVVELQLALHTLEQKITIRRQFVNREIDATRVDLLIAQNDAQQKLDTLRPKIDFANTEVARIDHLVQMGLAAQLDAAQARLKLQQLQMELAQAEVDLAAVRKLLGR
jgi:hypothetical protein